MNQKGNPTFIRCPHSGVQNRFVNNATLIFNVIIFLFDYAAARAQPGKDDEFNSLGERIIYPVFVFSRSNIKIMCTALDST